MRVKAKRVVHSGVVGYPIDSVGTGTITVAVLADETDDWNGRIVSVISDKSDGSAAIWNFAVTRFPRNSGAAVQVRCHASRFLLSSRRKNQRFVISADPI